MLWSNVIDVFRGGLFVLAHVFGGSLGAAILVASAAIRVALLPITVKSARRRILRERMMRALAPELDAIKTRYAKQPGLIAAKTRAVQEAHGIKTMDLKDTVASALQLPPAMALYATIRGSLTGGSEVAFLWVRSLVRPDRGLALFAAVVSGLMARASTTAIPHGSAASLVVPALLAAIVTFALLSHLGAGLALYSIANSIINGVERMVVERTLKPVAA